ncbi:MAG: hypothetical protein WCK11_05865 [Candidatus Falkowbacteria bacterium]
MKTTTKKRLIIYFSIVLTLIIAVCILAKIYQKELIEYKLQYFYEKICSLKNGCNLTYCTQDFSTADNTINDTEKHKYSVIDYAYEPTNCIAKNSSLITNSEKVGLIKLFQESPLFYFDKISFNDAKKCLIDNLNKNKKLIRAFEITDFKSNENYANDLCPNRLEPCYIFKGIDQNLKNQQYYVSEFSCNIDSVE